MAFETSALYKEAINSSARTTYIDGELITVKGTSININNDIIDQGSFYITNQCVSGDLLAYGSVFSAEASITLNSAIDRYSLYDSSIQLFFNILLSNNEYERIPLGKFFVSDPKRLGKNITLKAYDKMVNLDEYVEESTTGKSFELLSLIAEKFGFELAQSQEEIESLINGKILLSVDQAFIETYRDLLSYIGMVTCTFVIFDRYGKLKLCTYANEVSKEIGSQLRTASAFSDFESYYSSITASFLVDGAYETYLYDAQLDGLLYNMGEVPIVQGTSETNQIALDNIYSQLSLIKYTPCDITFSGDPSIDLGDKIINVDRFGNEITSLVTYYKWSYRRSHQIKSAGANPKLGNIKEKASKDIMRLQAEISKKSIPVYAYTNTSAYDIESEEIIATINFASNEDTSAVFISTVNFEMNLDGVVELGLYIDNIFVENSIVSQYCAKGSNTITFSNYIPCKKGRRYALTIKAKAYYKGESDVRRLEAKTLTNENARDAIITSYEGMVSALKTVTSVPVTTLNNTISYDIVEPSLAQPTMRIEKSNIKAIVFAQGLSATPKWDGTITFGEVINSLFNVDDYNASVFSFSASPLLNISNPISSAFNLAFSLFDVEDANVNLIGTVSDDVILNETIKGYFFDTSQSSSYEYDSVYVDVDGRFKLKELSGEIIPQNIISNKIPLAHETITGIERAVVICEGDLIMAVSFDDKQTWKAWNGSQWSVLSEEFSGMNADTLQSMTFENWNELYAGADGYYIRISLIDKTQAVTEIYVDYAN